MQLPIPKLEKYGMSPEYGFLPPISPSKALASPYFSPWENIIADLQNLLATRQIRRIVHQVPTLSTRELLNESEWQRAYNILCFIAHGYIWGEQPAVDKLPASISVPWLEVCAHLGMLPTITYAALCLWNFRPVRGESLENPDNLVALHTFTGTADESWFHIMSVAVEARGAPLVPILLQAVESVRYRDCTALAKNLNNAATVLSALGPLLQRMYEHLDPKLFFNEIRPFLAGSRNLPNGLAYEDNSGNEEYHKYGGGSAAQSSLFQFCDIVLGIQHGDSGDQAREFLKDMRNYMPGNHRRFLEDVSEVANVRPFVREHGTNQELAAAYARCLDTLKAFRDKHIGIVTRYIVIPSKASSSQRGGQEPSEGSKEAKVTGSAGSELIPFLKQMRDDTKR